ncbi:hypothetical protein JB92DRAFT_2923889, partial [Gautieria morchelliformis]
GEPDLLLPTLHCLEMSIDVNNLKAVIAYAPAKYGAVAALAMLTYDYAITFDDEFEFVWKRPWSLGKILFIFYQISMVILMPYIISIVISDYLLDTSCRQFIWWNITSEVIAIIYAVYNCSRRLLLVMIVFLVAAIACSSWLAISTLFTITQMKVSGTTGCPNGPTPPHAFFFWIPFLAFETLLVALMLCKGWRVYRSEGCSRLLHLIIRDRYAYMACGPMFITLLANCIVWLVPSLDPRIAAGWANAMPCAVGCRLLLNMRERFYTETTTIRTVMSA